MIDAITDPETVVRRSIHNFAAIVFNPSDVVEVRRIKPDADARSSWHRAHELSSRVPPLMRDNAAGWNIFAGANPRRAHGRRKDAAVPLARTVFADFDGTPADEALMRCESAGLPLPTLTDDSGHGTHAYWRLTTPAEDLAVWRELQKDLARAVGGDSKVCNPERIMRLPGFLNVKHLPYVPCTIVSVNANLHYPFEDLRGLIPAAERPAVMMAQRRGRRGRADRQNDNAGNYWLERALRKASAPVSDKDKGTRNNTGLWLACQLRDAGVPEGEATTILRDYAAHVSSGAHSYTEREALASCRWAYSMPARAPARRLGHSIVKAWSGATDAKPQFVLAPAGARGGS